MFISMILKGLTKISLYKQKILCNCHEVIYVIDDKNMVPYLSPKITLNYRCISKVSDLNNYSQNSNIKKYICKFQYFLDSGNYLYLVFVGDDIAGYYWVADLSKFKPYAFNKNSVFDGDDIYFIFFCKTFERYRNLGLYSYILTQICRDPLFDNGRILISTGTTNSASQRGIEKAGFKKMFVLRYFNLGGLEIINKFK